MKPKQPQKNLVKRPQAPSRPVTPKKPARPHLALGARNYVVMGAGLLAIVIGYITLAGGSTSLAPLLLVLGYCVIIPVGLLLR